MNRRWPHLLVLYTMLASSAFLSQKIALFIKNLMFIPNSLGKRGRCLEHHHPIEQEKLSKDQGMFYQFLKVDKT